MKNTTTLNQFQSLSAESSVDRMAVVTTEEVFDPTATSLETVTVVMEFDTRTDANGRATNGREKVMVKNVKRTDDAINETMVREVSKRHALPRLIWFY